MAEAQSGNDTTMLLFDLSGSMADPAQSGLAKIDVAKSAMVDAIEGAEPESFDLGVRSFSDCGVTTLESAPVALDPTAAIATINGLTIGDETDIATALAASAGDFAGATGRKTVVLLSDGAHNCAGDPCAVASSLIANGVDVVVHTIGIGTGGTSAQAELACIASVTGGTSVSVDDAAELFSAIERVLAGQPSTSALILAPISTCINSATVQDAPELATARVGDIFIDGAGNHRVIITGESCDFACVDGFDMNCDDALDDFCPVEFDRNEVAGASACAKDAKAQASEEAGDSGEGRASGVTCPALSGVGRLISLDDTPAMPISTACDVLELTEIVQNAQSDYREDQILAIVQSVCLAESHLGVPFVEQPFPPTNKVAAGIKAFCLGKDIGDAIYVVFGDELESLSPASGHLDQADVYLERADAALLIGDLWLADYWNKLAAAEVEKASGFWGFIGLK